MNQKSTKYTKLFIAIFLVIILVGEPLVSQAFLGGIIGSFFGIPGGPGSPSGSGARKGINDFLENDLNINVQESLKPMAEGVNAGDRKIKTAKVSLRFSTPNPKPNEKLTVSADVEGLANVQDAYYVWFLKREGDSYDDVDKLHKNAIKAQAGLYYDPEMFDQPFNQGIKEGKTNDGDSYAVKIGGDNSNEEEGYCYIYDMKDGKQYELAEGGEAESGCEDGFVPRCLIDKNELQCPIIVDGFSSETETETNTSGSSSTSTSTTTIGGLGGKRFYTLKQCVDTGIRATCSESTHKLFCKSDESNIFDPDKYYACDGTDCDEYEETGECCNEYDSEEDCEDEEDPEDCKAGSDLMSVNYDYDSEALLNVPTPYCVKKDKSTGQVWTDPNLVGCLNTDGSYTGSGCKGSEENVQKPKECRIGETKKAKCGPDIHLFSADDVADMSEEIENQYGTNPIDNKTTPLAENDGALIAGVGVKDFTWKYQEGDEVTVIVEGQGLASTKHEDASYQTVFAMPAPGCKALEEAKKDAGKYGETIKKKVIEIDTVKLDPAECLSQDLFTKPGTSEYDALNVTVSSGSSSASSASTPSGVGKEMKITAHAGQTQGGSISNSNHLYYEWEMKCKGEDTNLLTDESFKDNVTSKTKGMNIPNLTFIADFPDKCFSDDGTGTVEVTTKINEPRSGGGSNFGKNTTEFKIFNVKDNPIKVYKTKVVDTTKFKKTDEEICVDGLDKTICRVLNNEVIAVVATCSNDNSNCKNGVYNGEMISWKVNGKNYTCDESISPDCSDQTNTGVLLLPTNGLGGDTITVTAQISDVDKDKNQSQSIMRVFKVTDPELLITPVVGASWKVLGVYEDLDDNKFLDESKTTLETIKGKTVTLKAQIYPSFVNKQKNLKYEWFVDGELYDTDNVISFVPDKDVSVSVKVVQDIGLDQRLALEEGMGITQSQTTPQTFTANVKIDVNKDPQAQTAGIKGFFATVSHNASEYLLFLLKMTLIIGIMLFIPSLVIGFGVQEEN